MASALVSVTDKVDPLPATVQPAPPLVWVVKDSADRPQAECPASTAKPPVP